MNIPIRPRAVHQPHADSATAGKVKVEVKPGVVLGFVCLGPEWGVYCGLYVATCGCGRSERGNTLVQGEDRSNSYSIMLAHHDCLQMSEG